MAAPAVPREKPRSADALTDALEGRRGWQDLELEVECRLDEAYRRAAVFGSGVGIWNDSAQFPVGRSEMTAVLKALRLADFKLAAEEPARPGSPGRGSEPLTILCRVKLTMGGASKEMIETSRSKQMPELEKLAREILRVCAPAARHGLGATNLADGLRKLADGRLAPETFELLVNRKPERGQEGDGWLLRIDGRRVQSQRQSPSSGQEAPHSLELRAQELSKLARLLADRNLDGLPPNLYNTDYVDLEVAVLNRRKSVQARRFDGMTPQTHEDSQKALGEILDALSTLHARAIGS